MLEPVNDRISTHQCDGGVETGDMGRHPAHDELVVEVARWYREPTPEMGYDLVEGRFGWFNRPMSTGRGRGTVRPGVGAADVDALVAEAQEAVALDSLELVCDDRATAAEVGPALEARGFEPATATVFLAYVGEPDQLDGGGPNGLAIDEVPHEAEALRVWGAVKLQAFADAEEPPSPDALDRELAVRHAEMAGHARALTARLGGEAVAICGFYEGHDRFVFLLGTRLPFRHRGIGRALLSHVMQGVTALGCRSVVINGDEGGRPVALYQRLGFTDEVHWRRSWSRKPRTG
jgi:GNAT superfamily N-acetyltransferase